MRLNVLNRKVHYWLAAIVATPLIVIALTGSVLQLKKHSAWVQPPETRGSVKEPTVDLAQVMATLKATPGLGVEGWAQVNRMDVRPDKGVVKVWLKSNWEAQVDLGTAEILQIAYRRSDWIESIHDGSIFGDTVKLGIFFPTAISLVILWCGGVWMFVYPFIGRRRVRKTKAAQTSRLLNF